MLDNYLNIAADAGFQNTVLPTIDGTAGKLPPIATKLNGVIAATKPILL